MTETIELDNFALSGQGPVVAIKVPPGQSLSIVGSAGAGKSRLIRCLCGLDRPVRGRINLLVKPRLAGKQDFTKKSTPQSILRNALNGGPTTHVADALIACGLWDVRNETIASFTPSRVAACELLPCLGTDSRLMAIDGQLDRLDPWTLSSVLDTLRQRLSSGAVLVTATNRPDLAAQHDFVIALDHLRCLFSGKTEDLLVFGPKAEVRISSTINSGVAALVESFKVGVQEGPGGTAFHAEKGQDLAARLLLEGYGDVDFVVVRQPSIEQSLMHLTKTAIKKLKS